MAKKNIDYSKLQLGSKKSIRKPQPKDEKQTVADVAVQKIHQQAEIKSSMVEEKERTKRVTLDIPISLHAEIRKKTFDMGITMKKYFLDLAREDL
ncbi:MAG: hypothetical protein AAF599_12275 [Bacteroidota bacterium]